MENPFPVTGNDLKLLIMQVDLARASLKLELAEAGLSTDAVLFNGLVKDYVRRWEENDVATEQEVVSLVGLFGEYLEMLPEGERHEQ